MTDRGDMTEVVILAQGNQSRMGNLPTRKQLLPLPACGGMPIIARTMTQVIRILNHPRYSFRLVAWPEIYRALQSRYQFRSCALHDPGNSSLKGIQRYLTIHAPPRVEYDRTVVLLGDVVYDWTTLRRLLGMVGDKDLVVIPPTVVAFSHDLSPSGGELWGVAWRRSVEYDVIRALVKAMAKHPPFEEYQPGQLRKWFWAMRDLGIHRHEYVTETDNYIMDVDLPEHIPLLARASERAREEDARYLEPWREW